MDQECKLKSKPEGISLFLTVTITGLMLIVALTLSEIVLRQSRISRGYILSEISYYGAESALEKVAFDLLQNHLSLTSYPYPEGNLDNGANYRVENIEIENRDPGDGKEITNLNPWEVTLSPGQSFFLSLDINVSATYPEELEISSVGSEPAELIIYECETALEDSRRNCGTSPQQEFYYVFPADPYTLPLDIPTKYYKIILKNSGQNSETFILRPTGLLPLPIGLRVTSNGEYYGYRRKTEGYFPKWQIY